MIFKKIIIGIVALSSLFFLINCSSSTETENTSRVQLKLVDAPGDYLGVNVEIIDIQYKSNSDDEAWESFIPTTDYPIQVDLTDLTAGNYLLLADNILPVGNLHQIRLILSDNNTLEIEGDTPDEIITEHLSTPSAQQSGLKLKIDQELEGGFFYSFILDWDVQQSIVKAGNSGKYNLKPVIRVIVEANSGSLKGMVTADIQDDDSEHAPLHNATIAIYDISEMLVAQTMTNEEGEYMLVGIPPGSYHLEIKHDLYVTHASEDTITISNGEILDYGSIELIHN
ncbi:MAG: hypothetical protein COB81_08300 [Flavobacteriaceae bacterium]|nr:MAG: hypothetical protein COB81_08300 [Flavobacteriaceae bacterium]